MLGANSDQAVGIPVFGEIHGRVLEWLPNAKPFVLGGAAHLLKVAGDMARRLASFLKEN